MLEKSEVLKTSDRTGRNQRTTELVHNAVDCPRQVESVAIAFKYDILGQEID